MVNLYCLSLITTLFPGKLAIYSSILLMISMMWKQVKTVARIVQGDAGKVICKEAERIKPAAVVLGTRGRSLFQRWVCVYECTLHSIQSLSISRSFSTLQLSMLFFSFFSVIQGSVGEYCFHHCKAAPVVIVPGKGVHSSPNYYSFIILFFLKFRILKKFRFFDWQMLVMHQLSNGFRCVLYKSALFCNCDVSNFICFGLFSTHFRVWIIMGILLRFASNCKLLISWM